MFKANSYTCPIAVFIRYLTVASALLVVGGVAVLIFLRIDDTVFARGEFEPEELYELTSMVDGRIAHIQVKEGERAAAGDLLIQMDDSSLRDLIETTQMAASELEAELEVKRKEFAILQKEPLPTQFRHAAISVWENQEALGKAEEKFVRYRQLRDKSAISLTELDNVELDCVRRKADLQRSKANQQIVEAGLAADIIAKAAEEIKLLEAKLANKRNTTIQLVRHLPDYAIKAPSDGRVVESPHKPGVYIEKGAVAMRLAAMDRKKLTVKVGERDIYKIKIDQKARVSSAIYDWLRFGYFEGTVLRVKDLPTKSNAASEYAVEILIDDKGHDLKLGSTGEAVITVGRDSLLYVVFGLGSG